MVTRSLVRRSPIGLLLLPLLLVACSSTSKAGDDEEYVDAGERTITVSIDREELRDRDDDDFDPLRAAATAVPEEVEQFEVDGLTVILRPTGPTFHTIFAKLYIRGGLTALPKDLSPAVEQMTLDVPRFSGPAGMDRRAFQKEVDRLYIGLGATAEKDFSTMSLRSVDENFDRAWELYTGIIMSPSFDPTAMTNIRERAIAGVKNRRAVPESYAGYLADSIFFEGHPYGRVSEVADYEKIDEQILRDYHRKLFVKDRLFLVVVGNVTREEITEKIRASLGKLPEGSYRTPKVPVPENAKKPRFHFSEPFGRSDVPTNYLVVRFLAPTPGTDEYYAMERLRAFMGGMLFRRIRIERNLSYAPGATTYDFLRGYGDISISTALPDSAWRVTRSQIIDFFREIVIDNSNLENIPATWYTGQYMDQQTAESQASQLGDAHFYQGDWREAFRSLDRYLEVDADELHEAAREYLRNFTIVIVGNRADVDPYEYAPRDPEEGV